MSALTRTGRLDSQILTRWNVRYRPEAVIQKPRHEGGAKGGHSILGYGNLEAVTDTRTPVVITVTAIGAGRIAPLAAG